jgi:hypothetical protein
MEFDELKSYKNLKKKNIRGVKKKVNYFRATVYNVPVNKGLSMGCLLLEIQVGLLYKYKIQIQAIPTDNIMHLYYKTHNVSAKTAVKILLLLLLRIQ